MKFLYKRGNTIHTCTSSSRTAVDQCVSLMNSIFVTQFAVCVPGDDDVVNWVTIWTRERCSGFVKSITFRRLPANLSQIFGYESLRSMDSRMEILEDDGFFFSHPKE
jgi:acyl-ACP thioesterase